MRIGLQVRPARCMFFCRAPQCIKRHWRCCRVCQPVTIRAQRANVSQGGLTFALRNRIQMMNLDLLRDSWHKPATRTFAFILSQSGLSEGGVAFRLRQNDFPARAFQIHSLLPLRREPCRHYAGQLARPRVIQVDGADRIWRPQSAAEHLSQSAYGNAARRQVGALRLAVQDCRWRERHLRHYYRCSLDWRI